ncbi:hypothetical protein, partial [Paracidovorax cattleyae]|uniref:hypothetical protein n=1 Tax=Paracidovorax cattleyae TaxID=80868 RepID=UPI001E30B488
WRRRGWRRGRRIEQPLVSTPAAYGISEIGILRAIAGRGTNAVVRPFSVVICPTAKYPAGFIPHIQRMIVFFFIANPKNHVRVVRIFIFILWTTVSRRDAQLLRWNDCTIFHPLPQDRLERRTNTTGLR